MFSVTLEDAREFALLFLLLLLVVAVVVGFAFGMDYVVRWLAHNLKL